MTLAEKIRELRAEQGMSQEALAERLHVSRQAVTKWETGAGVPDVDNLLALADAFGLTLDELLGRTPGDPTAADEARLDAALDSWARDAPGTSRTEYDIDRPKHYDINLGGARRILLRGIAGEKLRVQLAMPGRNDVASRFKVRIDDNRENIDVDAYRCNGATETEARENLEIELGIPASLLLHVELSANTDDLVVCGLGKEVVGPTGERPGNPASADDRASADTTEHRADPATVADGASLADGIAAAIDRDPQALERAEPLDIELGGRLHRVVLDNVNAHVEIDCNADLLVECPAGLPPRLDVNQLHGTSTLLVPPQTQVFGQVKGLGNRILVKEGVTEASAPASDVPLVELNGMRSELTITAALQETRGL